MKRIVLLLAVGLMTLTSDVFAQLPALQKGDPLTFMVENHLRDREYQERIYWERAKKIGMYDTELSYDFVGTYEIGRPAEMESGNEYWLPAFTAKVTNVLDRDTCELCFDIGYHSLNSFPNQSTLCFAKYAFAVSRHCFAWPKAPRSAISLALGSSMERGTLGTAPTIPAISITPSPG